MILLLAQNATEFNNRARRILSRKIFKVASAAKPQEIITIPILNVTSTRNQFTEIIGCTAVGTN